MFRIEMFCDDKNLPRVLHQLAGLVLGTPKINPVANAGAKAGEVKSRTNGDLLALFSAHLKQRKLTAVMAADVREFARANGYREGSYSHILAKAIAAKLLRKRAGGKGTKTTYTVIGEA
jgi:hypothetical protein